MRIIISSTILFILFLLGCEPKQTSESTSQNIVTTDVENFWMAYDKINSTSDTTVQMQYLKELFIDKGTPGLEAIMKARRYQPKEYLNAINDYPKFWNSIRKNTNSIQQYSTTIQKGIDDFKEIYPDYKPAKVYFEIGVFRTPGTTLDSLVLIGAELAMTNKDTDVSELPESLDRVGNFAKMNPIDDLAFLNVHEYVHTQQNVPWAYDLLSQSVYEGSAEFIAEIAMKQKSIQPSISFGQQNDDRIKEVFTKEMFSPWYYHWIWNDTNNEFETRDLGYYVGYAIVKKYYDKANDKEQAIKKIIELDYTNQDAVENFVERTNYFSKPLSFYKKQFEKSRPRVIGFEGIKENDQNVNPYTKSFTVNFSTALDKRFRSTDFSELGKNHFPKINGIEFSEDGKSAIYDIGLKPNTVYEMKIDLGYRTDRAIPLVPYIFKFKTGK